MPLPMPSVARYEDPLEGLLDSSDLEEHVSTILQYAGYLSEEQARRLRSALATGQGEPMTTVYGADFDLGEEVEQQIRAVRAVRDTMMQKDGTLRTGVATRDAREIITSGGAMLNSLMKYHAQIVNMQRLRNLEQAVIATLKEVSPDLLQKVMSKFEERLEGV